MEQNLNHYKIFYEVAKCGNISKAAEKLYISQPAVSKSISKLEQSLSHTLFIRSKRGVRLTDEGATLYEYLDKAFNTIEHAEKKLRQISELGMGQLRIGASTSLCKHILLPYLQEYIELNPHVKVSIDCNPTFQTLQQLDNDKIDIGLICETDLPSSYSFMPLRSIHDTFVATKIYLDNLALRESHKLINPSDERKSTQNNIPNLPNITGLLLFTDNQNEASPDIYLTEKEILETSNLMLLDQGNISRIYIDEYMERNNIKPSQILEINNMDLLIDFAAIGMGVAGVVREFVTDYIESDQVTEIPMDYDIPPRTVGLVYNKNSINATAWKFIEFSSSYQS